MADDAQLTPPARPGAHQIDTSRANVARAWNFMVGGKDNFEADRVAARRLMEVAPVIEVAAPASRAFLGRAVRFLAAALRRVQEHCLPLESGRIGQPSAANRLLILNAEPHPGRGIVLLLREAIGF